MFLIIVTIFIIVALIYYVIIFLANVWTFWSSKNVKQKNVLSVLHDIWYMVSKQIFIGEIIQNNYNFASNSRYTGMYQLFEPVLLIRDPDLIKEITVQHFDHFPNHMQLIPASSSVLWNRSLVGLVNQDWKEMRSTLSPAFTGSKMKLFYSHMEESSKHFVDHFWHQDSRVITIEASDIFTRLTNDVILNTIFGIRCNSMKEKENMFFLMGREAAAFLWKHIYTAVFYMLPNVAKSVGSVMFSQSFSNFFGNIVKETIETRKNVANLRPIMIDILLEAFYKKKKKHISNEDITAQALLFYFAGLESVANLISFMAHELAVNPQIQEKLYKTIKINLEKNDGKISYESISHIEYLDMVVSETLRKWPNIIGTDRKCCKDYTLQPKSPLERSVTLKKDSIIIVPIIAIQRDPKYFPNPDLFDPERFSPVNKADIRPYTYMPFGTGPRSCMGARYTIQIVKVLFCHVLTHFEIVAVEKTQIPLQVDKTKLYLTAEKGFWLGLKKRDMS